MFRTALLAVAIGCFLSASPTRDDSIQAELQRLHVPETLVPKDKQPVLMVRAEGAQTYVAEEKDGKLQWGAATPDAKLLDFQTGADVGSHSKGPIWVAKDGSKVTGKMVKSEPSPNSSAIAWLLIDAVKNENDGSLAKVKNVQRLDTWGGKASGTPTKVGESQQVRYEATYVFWTDK